MKTVRKITRATTATAVMLVVLTATACSSTSGLVIEDPETTTVSTPQSTSTSVSTTVSTSTTTTTPSTTTSSTPTSTTPMTGSTGFVAPTETTPISAKEAADRAAVEKIWLDYQSVANDLWKQPEATWKAVLQKYAVDPALTTQLDGLKAFVAAGKDNWGEVVHHPYWLNSIDGGSTADLMDCIDASNAGSKDAKTGKKLSIGVAHQNTYITLLRYGSEWKVMKVTYLVNQACPGAELTANEEKASMEAARRASTAPTSQETR